MSGVLAMGFTAKANSSAVNRSRKRSLNSARLNIAGVFGLTRTGWIAAPFGHDLFNPLDLASGMP